MWLYTEGEHFFYSRDKHSKKHRLSTVCCIYVSSPQECKVTLLSHKHSACGPVWHVKPSRKYTVHRPHVQYVLYVFKCITNKQTSSYWCRHQRHMVFFFGSKFQLPFIGRWQQSLVVCWWISWSMSPFGDQFICQYHMVKVSVHFTVFSYCCGFVSQTEKIFPPLHSTVLRVPYFIDPWPGITSTTEVCCCHCYNKYAQFLLTMRTFSDNYNDRMLNRHDALYWASQVL